MSGTDYLSLGTDAVLLRAISAFGREDIVFSDVVTKINRKDRPQVCLRVSAAMRSVCLIKPLRPHTRERTWHAGARSPAHDSRFV